MKLALTSARLHVSGAGNGASRWRHRPGVPTSSGKADLVEEIVRIAGLDQGRPRFRFAHRRRCASRC
jgi:hypothetical protein